MFYLTNRNHVNIKSNCFFKPVKLAGKMQLEKELLRRQTVNTSVLSIFMNKVQQ
jgi:hypothetical protein